MGKELVARALHYDSKRSNYPFVAINCASLKSDLLENELFGHVKGAFTGATNAKDGIVNLADRGTLFIDEIVDMNLHIQASLLRFIENGTYRPMGSPVEQKVGVRIVAAVNRIIEKEVERKKFRHDLYYRLNVCRIDIPPLRKRKKDISLLIDYFLSSKISATKNKITTVFGNGEAGFSGDGGPALEADINFPTAVKVDNKGNVYFMESNNHVLRKLTPM